LSPQQAPRIISVSPTAIQFEWIASPESLLAEPLTNYKIYDEDTLIGTVGPQTLSHTYSLVNAGQSYMISITAVSAIGESE
jgi:hypothetical protein